MREPMQAVSAAARTSVNDPQAAARELIEGAISVADHLPELLATEDSKLRRNRLQAARFNVNYVLKNLRGWLDADQLAKLQACKRDLVGKR